MIFYQINIIIYGVILSAMMVLSDFGKKLNRGLNAKDCHPETLLHSVMQRIAKFYAKCRNEISNQ